MTRTLSPRPASGKEFGLSLVEVMVTLAIGMIVTLGILGVVGLNQQNLRITESLSESQENARMAFELMARDIRQARDTSCGPIASSKVTSLGAQDAGAGTWWGSWVPIRGFARNTASNAVAFGSTQSARVSDTEALQLQGTSDLALIKNFESTSKVILKTSDHTLAVNDIVVMCDLENASLHRVTAVSGSAVSFAPPIVISSADNPQFQIARRTAVTWYIGNNARQGENGRSLYRTRHTRNGVLTEEILPGVAEINLQYLLKGGAKADAATASAFNDAALDTITAVELNLTTESTHANVAADTSTENGLVGSDGRLRRNHSYVIALRNTL